jgi:beta-glucanase (GH16 family)
VRLDLPRAALAATLLLAFATTPLAYAQPTPPHAHEAPREWDDTARAPEDAIGFVLYTTHRGTLKLTAQLYPLADGVSRDAFLEVRSPGEHRWRRIARTTVDETPYGWPQADRKRWLAHFRIDGWDDARDHEYRVVAADDRAAYAGLIRRDPSDRDEIVVASLSCNSNQDRGPRDDIVRNLEHQDPDLLFFAGDQSYDHKKHFEAWLLFGRQFGELTRNRPTVTIPDDHDVGQGNLWGEGGVKASDSNGGSGGFYYSPAYVNAVQAAQTWHLPDPHDPTPVARGIGVYYTSLNVGGVDFAIIEDRKFKTGPNGLVRGTGPRTQRINDLERDPAVLDVPEAVLLGDRQLAFLDAWTRDWTDAQFKAVLSQTVFAQAAHLSGPGLWHGTTEVDLRSEPGNRMKFDFDSNGWPQSGRNRALAAIRKGFATHLCGDQHLATLLRHGVNEFDDAAVSFASPSIVNYFVRRWAPLEQAVDPIAGPLDHLGGYRDNFGNKITMLAYVNADPDRIVKRERNGNHWGPRAEGYGIVRFRKSTREITYEVWPRMVDATDPGATPYTGFPVTMTQMDQYARRPAGHLPEIRVTGLDDPVFEVIDARRDDTVYTIRPGTPNFRPHVFDRSATYRVIVGGQPGPTRTLENLDPSPQPDDRVVEVGFEPASARTPIPAGGDDAPVGHRLVWAREFDADGLPDPADWNFERGFSRNEELQWYQPDNAWIEDGHLVIEARRERVPNPNHEPGSKNWRTARSHAGYTSSSLTTRGKHEWLYGVFEMRARIDTRPGMWPAWWTLGSARPWPGCGEIDIMEFYRGLLLANACWKRAGGRWAQHWDSTRTSIADLHPEGDADAWSDEFHVWRMEWSEDRIDLFVDGRLLNSVDVTKTVNPDGSNPFREPHHMLVNVAVGGTQGGDPSATEFPGRYEIDYLRVYQRAD